MTDADTLELQQMLKDLQEELVKFRVENRNLNDHLAESQEELEQLRIARESFDDRLAKSRQELEGLQDENKTLIERLKESSTLQPVGGVQPSGHEGKAFKDLKAKYLQLHGERLKLLPARDQLLAEKKQLLAKLEQREVELKQLREETLPKRDDRPPVSHPDVERSLNTGDLSPDDPKAEIRKLRKVIEEKYMEIDILKVQLRSFEAVASGNMSLREENAHLKDKLKAAQVCEYNTC